MFNKFEAKNKIDKSIHTQRTQAFLVLKSSIKMTIEKFIFSSRQCDKGLSVSFREKT